MTRINCIPIEELTREHCFAEYREMPRLRHLWPRKSVPAIPTYRLGSGHVLFFADKGAWLEKRHQALYDRLVGHFNYNIVKIPILKLNHWPPEMMNDWEPDEDAMRISRERIHERLIIIPKGGSAVKRQIRRIEKAIDELIKIQDDGHGTHEIEEILDKLRAIEISFGGKQ